MQLGELPPLAPAMDPFTSTRASASGVGGCTVGLRNSFFINIGHVNLNCLTNKVNYVENLLNCNNIDILGVTETWLVEEVSDSYVDIEGYKIVRRDSPSGIRKHGAAMYIKNNFKYVEVQCSVNNAVIIFLPDYDIHIATIYRPPSSSNSDNTSLSQFLPTFCDEREVVIQGDLNLPSLDWSNESPARDYISPTDRLLYDSFLAAGLTQMVSEPTYFPSGSILDLCLLTHPERLGQIEVHPPLPSCHHGVVIFSYTLQSSVTDIVQQDSTGGARHWAKGNYRLISERLQEIDWETEFSGLDTQGMYTRFLEILNILVERFVPASDRDRVRKSPWQLNPPRSLLRDRSRLWQLYKDSRGTNGRSSPSTLLAWQNFVDINNQVKNFAISSQITYEKKIANMLKSDPKLFHSYLRHRRVGRPNIGPLKLGNGALTDNPLSMAECFVESFSSVFTVNEPANPEPHQQSPNHLENISATSDEIAAAIATLDPKSSMGADGVHPRLLRNCGEQLSKPLSIIFASSLREGRLPAEWLKSIVTPIFKKLSRTTALNYRPVSVTSVPCKVLEKVIVQHLNHYLEVNQILVDEQFGFRKKHSTVDQLILTYNDITSTVNRGLTVDLVFFDYTKAFDKVCHTLLLCKLQSLGINNQLITWIGEFLRARTMRVRVHGTLSSSRPVSSGVPQGSVLGPILFLIYVNHTVSNLTSNYKLFADDIKLYLTRVLNNPVHDVATLQQDIDTLVHTSSSWGLEMEASKCVCLRFGPKSQQDCTQGPSPYTLGNATISFVPEHKDLGVTVDRQLKFHSHINRITKTCNGISNNILSSTLCREANFMLNIFTTHIRPNLEYGSCIWNCGYMGDTRSLESVQRRWTKKITGLRDLSYAQRLRRLDLFSVQGRLLRADLIQVWKIFNRDCALEPTQLFLRANFNRRGHSLKLYLPRADVNCRRRFFAIRVINDWNSLSNDAVTASSLNRFKALLKRDLGQKLYDYLD